ncbi:MAG: IS481 family transposase, partial [Chlamydiota bacterium]
KRYHYDSHDQLKQHLYNFINAYNFAKGLKTLKGLTPYESIVQFWTKQPEKFKINPYHYTLGPNILRQSKEELFSY